MPRHHSNVLAHSRVFAILGVGFAGLAAAALIRSYAGFPAQTASESPAEGSSSSAEFILPIVDVDWRSEEGVAVFYFLQHGIIMGYPDPGGDPRKATFRGSEPISRAEAAKILLIAGRIPLTETQNNSRFLDVAEDEWYTPYVLTAAKRGIVTGYPPRHILFAPRNPVTAAEFLKMLTLTFALRERQRHNFRDVPADAWFAPFAGSAWQYKLFPERVLHLRPDSPLARRDVILALYYLFTVQRPRGVSEWFAPNIPGVPVTTIQMHAPSFTGECPPAPVCPPPPEPECRYVVELDRNDCAISCGTLECPKPPQSQSSIPTAQSSAGSSATGGGGSSAFSSIRTCGNALVDSRDGKTYATVLIGTQCWMAENMNIGTMTAGANNQGTDCPSAAAIEKYCYSDSTDNCTTYGGLYQWDQAMCGSVTAGAQGICPTGWHIPTDTEQHTLDSHLATGSCNASRSGDYDCSPASTSLKSGGASGFNGLLAGRRVIDGSFDSQSMFAFFWSSTESAASAWVRYLYSGQTGVLRLAHYQTFGFSVRCLKD